MKAFGFDARSSVSSYSQFLYLLFAVVTLVIGSGCEADRGAYSAVAANGVKLSTETAGTIVSSRNSLSKLIEGRLLVEGFTHKPLGASTKAEIGKLSANLSARADVLGDLSKAYTALGSLATYDASAEVEGAVNNLTNSVNKFATAVGSDAPPISGVTGKIVSAGSGQIGGAVQKAKLEASSAVLRERITRFRDLLKKERDGYVGASERISNEAVTVAIGLWQEGFGDPTGIIREHTGDLTPSADSKLIIDRVKHLRDSAAKPNATDDEKAKQKALEDSVSSVLKLRADRRLELTVAVIDETVGAFDDLISAHRSLEAGQPITLESLTAHLALIQKFAEELTQLRYAEKPTK